MVEGEGPEAQGYYLLGLQGCDLYFYGRDGL